MSELKEVFRKDYQSPDFWVSDVSLTFELSPNNTIVTTQLTLQKNSETNSSDLVLNGSKDSQLLFLKINDKALAISDINFNDENIILKELPSDTKTILLSNKLDPQSNTALEGLYLSNGIFCSDCEPEGFRNITFFPDRPDVMAKYTVTIIADKKEYPILLSNGNLLESEELNDGMHKAVWHDPFPKPSYLFALIAGDLAFIEDKHIRPDGNPVQLRIYAAQKETDLCHYALGALKRAMEWDEKRYGLVCDVDQYNVIAIHDFNGGAMENKGLNIFNANYVLANSDIATDADFEMIESIIGHEYFHNWTGNRVTCRDWFQLSLKEGLTVFRDQEFTSDLRHRGLKRIDDVKMLRTHQFPEDAGKLKHPIRPDSYVEMRNFYTTTVYEKGAEVVRLYQTLLGTDGFKKGLIHYLNKYDGTAATCDDFLNAMADANGKDLTGLKSWYSQSGTPTLIIRQEKVEEGYKLIFKQALSSTQDNLKPQWIPINYALINGEGKVIIEDIFTLEKWDDELFIPTTEENISFSFLRSFSAPVILDYPYSEIELMQIIRHEIDDFARWETQQRYTSELIASQISIEDKQKKITELFIELLEQYNINPSLTALLITLPDPVQIQATTKQKNLTQLWRDHESIMLYFAQNFEDKLVKIYQNNIVGNVTARNIKNAILNYLALLPHHEITVTKQYESAANMTDRMAALKASILNKHSNASALSDNFFNKFKEYPSVIDKWFALQASSPNVTVDQLKKLSHHEAFNTHNPNRVRALLGPLGRNKIVLYQQPSIFYTWLIKKIVMLDSINPQGAARLAVPFSQLDFLREEDKKEIISLIKECLNDTLSTNLTEQLSKSL